MTDSTTLYRAALQRLPYEPTPEQERVLRVLCEYACTRAEREAMILRGYAGTGKTSLMAALVGALAEASMKCVLLAPTGRAAKVFSRYARRPAYTIHKQIYRGDSLQPDGGQFFLAENKQSDTLFIVDEASMIPSVGSRVLSHLVHYVTSRPGCGLIFSGDTAQLPPVGEPSSLAMDPDTLASLGLRASVCLLDKPLRQAARSGVLYNATRLRRLMQEMPLPQPRLWTSRFPDVQVVSGEYVAEQVSDSYASVGQEETLVVTRSNWRAGVYNRGIRAQVLWAEEELVRGERLVIAKNNYFWTARMKGAQFLANGETAVVQRVHEAETLYGHRFARCELLMPDTGLELEAMLCLSALNNDAPSLTREQTEEIYRAIMTEKMGKGMDYRQALGALRSDPFYNALQAKYAYCLTCHKAQGGQWRHVYIDLAGIDPAAFDMDFYRWLYTAITRATERVYLINPTFPLL